MNARWLPVPGYPLYAVSDDGRVRSRARGDARELVCGVGSNGYRMVRLTGPSGRRNVTVHSLVAAAFVGPRPAGADIRHLDGNHLNNTVGNLCYGTRSENVLDSVRHGTHNKLRRAS